jgi:transaldolase
MDRLIQECGMEFVNNLKVKLFADGADFDSMMAMYRESYIKGFTTNPTLMRKAGISDYEVFAKRILASIKDRPVSFEVFADELDEMKEQALVIASWGQNVNVKIPVTNTQGLFCGKVVHELSKAGVKLNVTAVFTVKQVQAIAKELNPNVPAIVSVFAGRIADTGIDPIPIMREAKSALSGLPKAELLWASPRELLNIFHADQAGCDIITATPDILSKLKYLGKNLEEFSLETVRMFYTDAAAARYEIRASQDA